ncbi:MAG: hypothetical protein RJB13_56 [Pseudomonadota bacterium]
MKVRIAYVIGIGAQLIALASFASCIRSETVSHPASDSTLAQIQASCRSERLFLFSHSTPTLEGSKEQDWSCWYISRSNRVYGQPNEEESRKMLAESEPIVGRYINSNVLTSRLAEIDRQRNAIMWLGTGLALLGCGALAAGSGGLALAACTLLGSSPAAYDVLGGDPSIGANEAWRKMTEMSDDEIMKMECNAIDNIVQQARLIDKKILPFGRGSSKKACPSASSLLKGMKGVYGLQAGVEEVRKLKPPASSAK